MPPKKKTKTDGEKENSVVWTDDEIQLLLETVRVFKSEKASIDWESTKNKVATRSVKTLSFFVPVHPLFQLIKKKNIHAFHKKIFKKCYLW